MWGGGMLCRRGRVGGGGRCVGGDVWGGGMLCRRGRVGGGGDVVQEGMWGGGCCVGGDV